jgi:hypothetical protein
MTHVADESDRQAKLDRPSFCCPVCDAYAHQEWREVMRQNGHALPGWKSSTCASCDGHALWFEGDIVFPAARFGPPPVPDLPDSVRDVYREAQKVASISPRSAAALLRLALQLLVDQIQPGNENLNAKIGKISAAGVPEKLINAMDALRVIGNNAVHPGQISVDDLQTVRSLFDLLNLLGELLVGEPSRVQRLYEMLPPGAREAIERRDSVTERSAV